SDHDLIRTIKVNIRDGISRIIYSMWITNLEQLREECHEAERVLANRWSRTSGLQEHQRPPREKHQVHEAYVSQEPNEDSEFVEAISRGREGGAQSTL
ncbi:hypothetical protein KR084_012826, partial [Drosophila pseudotakahashii]